MKHRIYLNLAIEGFEDITHDDISRTLGMNPFKIYVKGEKRYSTVIWPENRWIMASPLDEYSSFEDQMNATLDIIEPKIDLFKPLCEKYCCQFMCAIYLRYDNGESMPWVNLGSRYNKLIREINIGFDFDLYVFPNEE